MGFLVTDFVSGYKEILSLLGNLMFYKSLDAKWETQQNKNIFLDSKF